MQSGTLKNSLKKFWHKINFLLNVEVFSLEKSFYAIYLVLSGFKDKISIKDLNEPYVFVRKSPLDFKRDFKTRKLEKNDVNINDAILSKNSVVTKRLSLYSVHNLVVRTFDFIEKYIRWTSTNLDVITIFRNLPFRISAAESNEENVDFKNSIEIKNIPQELTALERKVSTVEEIVEISPFVRSISSQKLCEIPIEKKPMPKYFFSKEEMAYFKETLAKSSNVNPRNVNITLIYDKFNIEFYSKIKQDFNSQNLLCYPNFSKTNDIKSDKLYYLVFGARKDNKVTLNALISLDSMKDNNI